MCPICMSLYSGIAAHQDIADEGEAARVCRGWSGVAADLPYFGPDQARSQICFLDSYAIEVLLCALLSKSALKFC